MKIPHRIDGFVLFEDDASSIKETLVNALATGVDLRNAEFRHANLQGVNLRGADLRNFDLQGADLQNADLRGANIQYANLWLADLRGADLQGVDFRHAYLRDAKLRDTDLRSSKLEWSSHDLMHEILRRAAGDDLAKVDFADHVLARRDLCWRYYLVAKGPLLPWALAELARWAQPGDGHPDCLDAYLAKAKTAE